MKLSITCYAILCIILQISLESWAEVESSEIASKIRPVSSFFKHRAVFTVVRFLNVPCSSPNGQLSGICFSVNDCARLQGTQIGTCASGFGVCCIFQRTCGTATNQNYTHFTNPGYPNAISESGEATCTLTLLRSHKAPICQIRLDFMDFDLNRPTDGNCLDDTFRVVGNNRNAPVPVICGKNSGQHMYINVEDTMGPIHLTVNTRGLGERKWNIKTSYIECANPSKAPPNCLQYFTGPSGAFSSFNYVPDQSTGQSGGYLNNMNYAICFRREAGRCSQTYEAADNFVLLNLNPDNSPTVGGGEAGLGVNECPTDYLRLGGDRYCGARLNPTPGTPNPRVNAPVVDNTAGPITAIFETNSANNALGFRLRYNQNPC